MLGRGSRYLSLFGEIVGGDVCVLSFLFSLIGVVLMLNPTEYASFYVGWEIRCEKA